MVFKILLATEKAFGTEAVKAIEEVFDDHRYALAKLENYKDREAFLTAASSADAIIVRSDKCDSEFFEHAKNLKVLARAGAGVDTIDVAAAKSKGICVMNTPGQNSNAVAELAFGMMIFMARSRFDGGMGTELRGKSLGLYGCGNVSKYIIQIAKGFGMTVSAFDPFVSPDAIRASGALAIGKLSEIFLSDFVSLHVPLTEETRGSIDASLLSLMSPTSVLINTARSEIINETDLMEKLILNPKFTYLADVQPTNSQELQTQLKENYARQVLVTPKKMGAQTIEANNNCAPAAAKQIRAFFESGDRKFQV